jgi:hypothetical protein
MGNDEEHATLLAGYFQTLGVKVPTVFIAEIQIMWDIELGGRLSILFPCRVKCEWLSEISAALRYSVMWC